MKNVRRNSRLIEDRHNVADQPGSAIFWTGVIISVVIGLALRGLMNPAKIQKMVEDAASRIHPNVQVRFESAHLSLASGFIPRLAVIIDKVRMESSNACWMAPRLYVDEIRLPISVTAWMLGHSPIGRLEAHEVEARVTAKRPPDCGPDGDRAVKTPDPTPKAESPTAPAAAVTLMRANPEKRENTRTSGHLESVHIDRLTLISEIEPIGMIELDRIDFLVRSTNPRVFQLNARMHLLKDESTGEHQTVGNLVLEYKEFPERLADLRFSGNWREGSYVLTGAFQPDLDRLNLKADLRHLPLSQLMAVLKRGGVFETDFQPRLSWLSFQAEFNGSPKALTDQGLRLSDLQLEGDLGDIRSAELQITKLTPLRFQPFRMEIRNLDFDRLLQFFNRPHPSPMLNRLGHFRGVAEIVDPMNFSLLGESENLEFIFSNKGQRELQNIKRLQGELRRRKGLWSVDASRAEINQGSLDGDIKISADEDLKNLDLSLRVDELSLSPAVQRLMTRGGHVGPAQSEVQIRWQEGEIRQVKGFFRLPSLKVEGVSIEKLNLQLGEKNGAILISPKIDRIDVDEGSAAWQVIQPFMLSSWPRSGAMSFNAVSGQFTLKKLSEVSWNKLSAQNDAAGIQFTSDGGWSGEGALRGQFNVRGKDLRQQWNISGTRDVPVLEKVTP